MSSDGDGQCPLYRIDLEHDACGVGFIADVHGRRSREIVDRGLAALCRLTHRGAAPETASIDGAGILTQIPWPIIEPDLPLSARDASGTRVAGMFFIPADARAAVTPLVEQELRRAGFSSVFWRSVPVAADVLEPALRGAAPEIQQAIAIAPSEVDRLHGRLHTARLRMESAAAALGLRGFVVVSLSDTTLVHKGLVTPEQLPRFYTDLQDRRFDSALILFHQRFSTNTTAHWELAQPFRLLAHNGEINTIAGNRLWMRARQPEVEAPDAPGAAPVRPTGSDSQSLDEAVELLVQAGFTLPHAFSRLIPPAWQNDREMSAAIRAFYQYQDCASEPWDGPAAIAFTDGRTVGALLDRNGFRPARFVRTKDDLVALGSEAGIFDFADKEIVERDRLGPGEMVSVDLEHGRVEHTSAIRRTLARQRSYRSLLARCTIGLPRDGGSQCDTDVRPSGTELLRLQRLFGYTREEIAVILTPMAADGHEAVGSMGDDTPVAVLSTRTRLLPDFFRQRFAQVTNPAIDPLRERWAMSLATTIGSRGWYLNEDTPDSWLISLASPILTETQLAAIREAGGPKVVTLRLLMSVADGEARLEAALQRLVHAAGDAVAGGAAILVLSDRGTDANQAPIPPLLATSAVHHGLIALGLRMRASLVLDTAEARDAHQVATLAGYGASAVCPYLAFHTVANVEHGTPAENIRRYQSALEEGLLKILSKMGVSTFSGYCGGQLFDIIGLSQELVERDFPGTPSPLGGLTIDDIAQQVRARHADAFGPTRLALAHPGVHGYRRDGEYHANNPALVKQLHRVAAGSSEAYRHFARMVSERPATSLRDLLEFVPAHPRPVEEVESKESICRRFFASAMSVGALSPEAHRVIAIAMNRLGARSNSGEGGEEPERFARPRGADWTGSATKQVASARFGVTPEYLISADELQIKIAQGSKPGEGGQLPAAKVMHHIARLRHAQPGTTLISPPVHHDIYSIEDLAQLVFDLRTFHPAARINVKLVAQAGVGIVAAGVAKAGADAIQISGHDGGTGASPRSSIKHAGSPWELGLAEAQQVLTHQGLRNRVVLQTDGGLKTGRDVAIAAALGAEEFGFGTAAVVAIGCVMARQCHLNTCPVGIATQRPDLRGRFNGTPEMLVEYFLLLAQEVREILASLGMRSMRELIGRTSVLAQRAGTSSAGAKLDVSPLLARTNRIALPDVVPVYPSSAVRHRSHATPDALLLSGVGTTRSLELAGTVLNTDRAVGARLAGAIAAQHGDAGLAEGAVRLRLEGSAGQSFGAFCLPGMSLHISGETNDYLGKSMRGGEIVVRAPRRRAGDVLVGNTALYGATGGRVFIGGRAGERFAVRNSGATAVVEGVGDHACEYMTGGLVVVLGSIGRNFAAGMSGGTAFVYDPGTRLMSRGNFELVEAVPLNAADERQLLALIADHGRLTGSTAAARLIRQGESAMQRFVKIAPKGMDAALGLDVDGELDEEGTREPQAGSSITITGA